MSEEEIKEKEKELMLTWAEGGSHSHNVIQWGLMAIAKHNKPEADRIFKRLQGEGY